MRSRVWIAYLCVWLVSHACLPSPSAETNAGATVSAQGFGRPVPHPPDTALGATVSAQGAALPRAPAGAPSVPEPCPSATLEEGNRVILQSETLEYFQAEKRVVATGNVTVTYGDKRLLADQLELHTDTNTGTAVAHVRLLSPMHE